MCAARNSDEQQGNGSTLWTTLESDDAKLWPQQYPGRSPPRRKAVTIKEALKLQRRLGVKLPPPDDEEIRPLDPEEVDIFLTYLDTLIYDKATGEQRPHRNAALYHVAIRCGLREGELIDLRWSDIDLKRRELRIASQIQKSARRKTKSGDRRRRTIPLSHDLVNVMELRFHHLRHTYAALNIAAGMDLYTLSRRIGHSSITVTADKYGHLYQGQTQDVDALDRLLKRSA
jgi:integrase